MRNQPIGVRDRLMISRRKSLSVDRDRVKKLLSAGGSADLATWRDACLSYVSSHAMFYATVDNQDAHESSRKAQDAERTMWEGVETITDARGRARNLLLELDSIIVAEPQEL